jgi:hypothetical protein
MSEDSTEGDPLDDVVITRDIYGKLFDPPQSVIDKFPIMRTWKNPKMAMRFGPRMTWENNDLRPMTDDEMRSSGERYNSATAVYDHETGIVWCDALK